MGFVDSSSPLEAAYSQFSAWLVSAAAPRWLQDGQAPDGGFWELLELDGKPVRAATRRGRVQSRQIQVYAELGRMGWPGPWRDAVERGLTCLEVNYLRPDGLVRSLLGSDYARLDETATLYDQAFMILARASADRSGILGDHHDKAAAARDMLLRTAAAGEGLREAGPHPYQANAQMHLLEACLAWEEAGGDGNWRRLSDRLVDLALRRFIDPVSGYLREFFSAEWTPADGPAGRLVEPGHQFEWSWLLTRYAIARGDVEILTVARSLYAAGLTGIDPVRALATDALEIDGSVRDSRARLWPQTEWLKAALTLSTIAEPGDRGGFEGDALTAMRALDAYLIDNGLWRDKCLESGDFVREPAPASSLYHIVGAWRCGVIAGLPSGLSTLEEASRH